MLFELFQLHNILYLTGDEYLKYIKMQDIICLFLMAILYRYIDVDRDTYNKLP